MRIATIQPPTGWFEASLENQGLLPNSQHEKNYIKIWTRETCTADSLLQALTWLYIDDNHFRKTVDKHIGTSPDDDVARFVVAFAYGDVLENIYRWRREFLSKHCSVISRGATKEIHCLSAHYKNIEDLITPLFPAMTSTTGCECRIQRKFVTIPFSYKHLGRRGLSGLQEAIDKRINDEKTLCKRCGQKHIEDHEFSDIAFVAVARHKSEAYTVKDRVGIPRTIFLEDQKFKFTCFTDLDFSKNHSAMNCRRKNGKWYHYDDNRKTAEILRDGSLVETDTLMYKRIV